MKRVMFVIIIGILLVGISNAQDKKVVKDTTLSLSIPALEKQVSDLQTALQNQTKSLEEAKTFVENTQKNIISLQASINAIQAVLNDKTFRINKNEKGGNK